MVFHSPAGEAADAADAGLEGAGVAAGPPGLVAGVPPLEAEEPEEEVSDFFVSVEVSCLPQPIRQTTAAKVNDNLLIIIILKVRRYLRATIRASGKHRPKNKL